MNWDDSCGVVLVGEDLSSFTKFFSNFADQLCGQMNFTLSVSRLRICFLVLEDGRQQYKLIESSQ